jgi:hypothetical protein
MESEVYQAVQTKVLAYRKLKAKSDALKAQMDTIKAELLVAVEANGKWTDEEGYARIVIRKPSVTFNTKALEVLCKSMPEIEEVLAPHRQIKSGYSYLQIK